MSKLHQDHIVIRYSVFVIHHSVAVSEGGGEAGDLVAHGTNVSVARAWGEKVGSQIADCRLQIDAV